MKEYITGIGGVFFRSADKAKTMAWYTDNFGMQAESWGKMYPWRHHDNEAPGSTTWSVFKNDTDYFGNSGQEFMINYRVRDLDELLAKLKANGISQVNDIYEAEYGRFAWVEDCDGRRIELWEPKD